MFHMKKTLSAAMGVSLAVGLLLGSIALAATNPAAPGQNKLVCFDGTTDGGYGGTCTVSNGAKGPATLDNTDNNVNGDYAGVYIQNSNLMGEILGQVSQLSYSYTGTTAPMPGDLSLNLPLSTGGYAYVDAYYCSGNLGSVDVINDSNCGIWYDNTEYANWAALAAAYPSATISGTPFIVAERTPTEGPAYWTINHVKFGKPGK